VGQIDRHAGRETRTVVGMGVLVWLLIPLAAVVVAVGWTSWLARRERLHADEEWRARRLAELGPALAASQAVTSVAQPKPTSEPAIETGESVSISSVEVDLTDIDVVDGQQANLEVRVDE